jgi:hypothetical protein
MLDVFGTGKTAMTILRNVNARRGTRRQRWGSQPGMKVASAFSCEPAHQTFNYQPAALSREVVHAEN